MDGLNRVIGIKLSDEAADSLSYLESIFECDTDELLDWLIVSKAKMVKFSLWKGERRNGEGVERCDGTCEKIKN